MFKSYSELPYYFIFRINGDLNNFYYARKYDKLDIYVVTWEDIRFDTPEGKILSNSIYSQEDVLRTINDYHWIIVKSLTLDETMAWN